MKRIHAIALAAVLLAVGRSAAAAELLSQDALHRLDAQRYWELDLTLDPGDTVARTVLLDDNFYVITALNRVHAVHALTGIVRWSRVLADQNHALRGPSHNEKNVFFTTGGSVVVLNRRTGELAGNPRSLSGVVIEVAHDMATISIGADHGVSVDDVLNVFRLDEGGEPIEPAIAKLKIESVRPRRSRGRVQRLDSGRLTQSGDRVMADVVLPLEQVKLPFAASCMAVADEQRIYVGASNERFYSLNILAGFQHWQLMTPKTVTAQPVLYRGSLYIAAQDGRVISCTKDDKIKNWIFETEGPIFGDLLVEPDTVYVASSDRSLYRLDRSTGKRRWRQRFDSPLEAGPALAEGRVYQDVPGEGLNVLDAETGEILWRRPEGGKFLVQLQDDAYLLARDGAARILRVEAKSGRVKEAVDAPSVAFADVSRQDALIVLVSAAGGMTCIRSRFAPRLSPEQVADALRDDEKARIAAAIDAGRRKPEKPPVVAEPLTGPTVQELLFEEDWLTSSAKAAPVGGHGLVESDAAKPGEAAAPKREKAEPDEATGEESEAEETTDEEVAEEQPEEGAEDQGEAEEGEEAESQPEDEGAEEGESGEDSEADTDEGEEEPDEDPEEP